MKIEEIEVGKKYWTVYGRAQKCAGKGEGVVIMLTSLGPDFGEAFRPESIACEFIPEPVTYVIEHRYTPESPRPWWRFGL